MKLGYNFVDLESVRMVQRTGERTATIFWKGGGEERVSMSDADRLLAYLEEIQVSPASPKPDASPRL